MPVFKELYQRVKTGKECARVLSACGKPDYQKQLTKELSAIGNSKCGRLQSRPGFAPQRNRPRDCQRHEGRFGPSSKLACWLVNFRPRFIDDGLGLFLPDLGYCPRRKSKIAFFCAGALLSVLTF